MSRLAEVGARVLQGPLAGLYFYVFSFLVLLFLFVLFVICFFLFAAL